MASRESLYWSLFYTEIVRPSHSFWRKEEWGTVLGTPEKHYLALYNTDKRMRHHPVRVLHVCDVLKTSWTSRCASDTKNYFCIRIPTIPWEVTPFLQLPAVPGNLTISGYRVICWRSQTRECAIKQNFWAVARKLDVFSWCAKKKEDNKEELWLWIWKNYSDPILKKAAKQLKY